MENIPLKIKKIIFNREKTYEILMSEIKQINKNILNDKKYFEMKINLLEQNLQEEKQKNLNLEKKVNELTEEINKLKKINYSNFNNNLDNRMIKITPQKNNCFDEQIKKENKALFNYDVMIYIEESGKIYTYNTKYGLNISELNSSKTILSYIPSN